MLHLIFDLGNIFVPIDFSITHNKLLNLGIKNIDKFVESKPFLQFEKGEISEKEIIDFLKKSLPISTTEEEILDSFNSLILDFDHTNFEYIKELKSNGYKISLLSNTNSIHIQYIKTKIAPRVFDDFLDQFDYLFLSYEMGKRKPNADIYEEVQHVIGQEPQNCLFIDDTKENLSRPINMGWKTLLYNVHTDDLREKLTPILT